MALKLIPLIRIVVVGVSDTARNDVGGDGGGNGVVCTGWLSRVLFLVFLFPLVLYCTHKHSFSIAWVPAHSGLCFSLSHFHRSHTRHQFTLDMLVLSSLDLSESPNLTLAASLNITNFFPRQLLCALRPHKRALRDYLSGWSFSSIPFAAHARHLMSPNRTASSEAVGARRTVSRSMCLCVVFVSSYVFRVLDKKRKPCLAPPVCIARFLPFSLLSSLPKRGLQSALPALLWPAPRVP